MLHYKAEWHRLNAGVATLRIDPTAAGQERVTGSADATGFVGSFYHVHDRFESVFNRSTFCSDHISKHTEEGFRRREELIRFDYAQGKSVRQETDLKNGKRQQMENAIPACATDVLSAVFYAASLPLQLGAVYSFPVNDGGQTAALEAEVQAREQVRTPLGAFPTVRVQPRSDSPLLKKRGKIWVWYSDDAERLPVQMRAHMGWGAVTLRLERIERTSRAAAAP